TLVQPSFNVFISSVPPTHASLHLSLHDALPILPSVARPAPYARLSIRWTQATSDFFDSRLPVPSPFLMGSRAMSSSLGCDRTVRSEEHTSELQSRENLVCRLLLEKKNHAITVYN